jgi:uncharacterized membrane protein YedE/YeeE
VKGARDAVAFVAGVLFSAGLALAGMTQPSKVLAFLDVAGRWDPTLAVVMASAVAVSAVAFRLAARRSAPLLDARFHFGDARGAVDARLVGGAALFGVGWGLSGLCPGPALALTATGQSAVLVFVLSMLAGMAGAGVVGAAARPSVRAGGASPRR